MCSNYSICQVYKIYNPCGKLISFALMECSDSIVGTILYCLWLGLR